MSQNSKKNYTFKNLGDVRLRSATHRPQDMTLFPKADQALRELYGLKEETIPEMPIPKLNERGRKLAGLDLY